MSAGPGSKERRSRPSVTDLQAANRDLMTLLLQLNAVSEMMGRTAMPVDRSRVLESIAHGVRAELGFDRVAVWRYDALSRSFTGQAGVGLPDELIRSLRFPLDAFMPLVGQVVNQGRVLKQEPGIAQALLDTVYEALGETTKSALLVPLLARGKDRCWRVRRVAEGCAKAEAGPEQGYAVTLVGDQIHASCLPCKVFPLAGVLWADNARSGRQVEEEILPLGLFLRHADLMLENAIMYEELSSVTFLDALTGVTNRAHFENLVKVEAERSLRYAYPMAVILLGVRGMRALNERAGRAAGDRLLGTLAELLQRRLRRIDYVSRYEGDTFALLLPHTDGERALQVARRLHEQIAVYSFQIPGWADPVKCCMGVAVLPENAEDSETVVGLADYALHEARQRGSGLTVRIGDPKPAGGVR